MIQYTREDLKRLHERSNESSPVRIFLPDLDFDPDKFEAWMKQMPKAHHYIYNVELDDLPTHISNPTIQGYIQWRFDICK